MKISNKLKPLISIFTLATTASVFLSATSIAYGAVRVSVTQFKNKSNGSRCMVGRSIFSWHPDLGSAFSDMLITKLTENSNIEVYERATIRKINDREHELINADEEDAEAPLKKKFKKAQYTIVGSVSEFEFCASGGGGGVDLGRMAGFGSLKVGLNRSNAKVVVDIRIIEVQTGRVLSSFKGSGNASSTGFDVERFSGNQDFDLNLFESSPLGEATRNAISEAADRVLTTLPGVKKI